VRQIYNTEKGATFLASIRDNLVPFEKDEFGNPDILKQWIKENLNTEIAPTDTFNNTIKEFLDLYEAKVQEHNEE
jgi:hypothetical protein